jgi:phosphatidylglycerol:prolipoprotein diacylglycerol transferase
MYPHIFISNSITIGTYGLMLALAYLIGRWYFLKSLSIQFPKIKNTEALIIILLSFGVIGAKLMFILKNPDKHHLLFEGTGFSSQGSIIAAVLATYFFTIHQKIKLSSILDTAAPAAILAYAIARIGCFLSGDDCYGIVTNLPWAMSFPNGIAQTTDLVHPLPLYEMIYSVFIFLYLIKSSATNTIPYAQFFKLLFLWGICRFTIEFLSTNPKLVLYMSGSQFGALLMVISSLLFFSLNKEKS